MLGRNLMLTLGIGAQQCAVTDQIDQAGYALALAIEAIHRPLRKDITPHAGNTEAVFQVGRQLIPTDGVQVIACCDPLIQLSQFRKCQHFLQFRLAKQDNLQQLLLCRLKIGQQP